jgi:hypothetical protein
LLTSREASSSDYYGKGEGRLFENAYGKGRKIGKADGRNQKETANHTGRVLQDL